MITQMLLRQKAIFMLCFIFLIQTISVQAITISDVVESPSQVEYEQAITITARINSSFNINQVYLNIDGRTYSMNPTAVPSEYQISLHTIDNLAALGFAVYPYLITAEDVTGDAVTYTDSVEVIISEMEGVPQSRSQIQDIIAWVRLWI